ncbi:MAG: dihydroorotase family protein [Candidatus Peribacteraceae bacterium]
MNHTLIKGGSILSEHSFVMSDVLIDSLGKIEKIEPDIEAPHADHIDATGKLLLPLLIDCHVHFREPGLEHKGTMLSEGSAAVAGGIGTVCEMPNTIPPTVTIAALADKVTRASHVDHLKMKFFFGITERANLMELKNLFTSKEIETEMLRRHVAGVKLYLDHSTGDQKVASELLEEIFMVCKEFSIQIVAHCEDPEMNRNAAEKVISMMNNRSGGSTSSALIELHSQMRPPESEVKAIEDAITLVRKTGASFHVAHLSTKGGLEAVKKAKNEGLPVTCEVAPHHLFLTTEDYMTLGALGKMNPPLRSMNDRDALWKGVGDGTVDCIATDHAPHTLEEKNVANPLDAPSGIPGVELMLPLLLTVASGHWPHPSSKKPPVKFSYADIVRLCGENPAKIFGLEQDVLEKGKIARLAVIDLKKEWSVESKNLKTKCGWSPYEGWKMQGKLI